MIAISQPVAKKSDLGSEIPALPVVICCEHASNSIPTSLGNLGLDQKALSSHIAWDIGALEVAQGLSSLLRVPMVHCTVSRLVYDCNRPIEATDSIPTISEKYRILGNENLSEADRQTRYVSVHDPFHAALRQATEQVTKQRGARALLITIHSFTPVYHGKTRSVELGYLYGGLPDLALAALEHEKARNMYRCALNEPYSAADGVTYTLSKHQETTQPASLMIEIKNDLIDTADKASRMAAHLADSLSPVISQYLSAEVNG